MVNKSKKRFGDILVDSGMITQEQLQEILVLQKKLGLKFGEVLIQQKIMTEAQIIQVLEVQLGIMQVNLETQYIEAEAPRLISENLAKMHCLIPISRQKNKLIVAMNDPLNIFAMDDVRLATGLEISPVIATKKDIESAIEKYYGRQVAEKAAADFNKQYEAEQISDEDEEMQTDINNAPIVRLVNSVVRQAVKLRASDIHIEPYEDIVRIRIRVDGDLREIMTTTKSTHSGIVTRIKIVGKLDISERRLPQDGRLETIVENRNVDMRISILPTVHGEKIVIRILDNSNYVMSMAQLGFSPNNLNMLQKIVRSPYGIILVTGPTGSGKSTTLYAMLKEFDSVKKNIITVEDPVEYKMDNISQVQANFKVGLDFAAGLRSILRQDPDIIMVGEIRDSETAQIAVRAAITGHIVLSSMHTNDTASTVTRLVDMGVDPFLVASSVVGAIAQRLVKKVCVNCKETYTPTDEEIMLLKLPENAVLTRGKGCHQCDNTGYKGRTAVHEIMTITREVRKLASQMADLDSIRDAAVRGGMVTLREGVKELVLSGVTTTEELVRIAYDFDE